MQQDNAMAPVQVTEIPLPDGKIAGQLTLNKPASLNALDLTMAQIMLTSLTEFAHREEVALVFIDAAGDKAFCVGGDVTGMVNKAADGNPEYAKRIKYKAYAGSHDCRIYDSLRIF